MSSDRSKLLAKVLTPWKPLNKKHAYIFHIDFMSMNLNVCPYFDSLHTVPMCDHLLTIFFNRR